MEKKYFVGIDFGHGETTVSRIPGYGSEHVSMVQLAGKGHETIYSAICKDKGEWGLVTDPDDFKKESLREGFKERISVLKNDPEDEKKREDLEAMKIFPKLIFERILDVDDKLKYDWEKQEGNFYLGIACPSQWVREDKDAITDYINFLKEECGLPVDMCIKESDAAFFSRYDSYSETGESVFVIDLGSSTIDFTTYTGKKCLADCCWGETKDKGVGAHRVDELIRNEIYRVEGWEEREKAIREHFRVANYEGKLDATLSLYSRKQKEDYYKGKEKRFQLNPTFDDLGPGLDALSNQFHTPTALYLRKSKEEFDQLIEHYKENLRTVLVAAKTKLNKKGVFPDKIFLTGGASNMPFVRKLVEDIFYKVHCECDPRPEFVVSHGVAQYMEKRHEAWGKLVDKLRKVDYVDTYINADRKATSGAVLELVDSVADGIKSSNRNYTGEEIRDKFLEFFKSLGPDHAEFSRMMGENMTKYVSEVIRKALSGAIKEVFHTEVDTSDVTIDLSFVKGLAYDKRGFLSGGSFYENISTAIESSSSRFFFTWDKPREYSERKEIADGVVNTLKRLYSDGTQDIYNRDSPVVAEQTEKLFNLTAARSQEVFEEKDLFAMSYQK